MKALQCVYNQMKISKREREEESNGFKYNMREQTKKEINEDPIPKLKFKETKIKTTNP